MLHVVVTPGLRIFLQALGLDCACTDRSAPYSLNSQNTGQWSDAELMGDTSAKRSN